MTPRTQRTIQGFATRGNVNTFFVEDKHMKRALGQVCLSLLSAEIQRAVEEKPIVNPNMKFNNLCDHFWETSAWQPHQRFEALVSHIKIYLVCDHFAKKVIPDEDPIDAFLMFIK